MAAEAAFGVLAGSLALLADAGHNLGDVLGLALSWGATVLGRRRPSMRFTYGFRSSSILAALANAIILLVVTGGIAWEAVLRLSAPASVAGRTVALVAAAGIVVNGATALLLAGGRKGDLNIRSAFLHMLADILVTAGVLVAGVAVALTGQDWVDPAVSLLVCVVIVYGTWGLVREAVGLALDAVPAGIDAAAVRTRLAGYSGVAAIHDLHIWGMSTTEVALTAHLVIPDGHPGDDFLGRVCHDMHDRFGIGHSTLQVETASGSAPCALAPDHVV